MINFRLAGIPCLINVTSFNAIRGEGFYADSTEDAKDTFEASYQVCDSRGRPAPWLARKINNKINSDILTAIGEQA